MQSRKAIFWLAAAATLTPWASPPAALLLGIALALADLQAYHAQARRAAKWLLQASVVALGFGMNLTTVLKAGADGFAYTIVGIGFALACGWAIGRALSVPGKTAYLISTGTAICGGSAIAAIGPIVEADEDQMSVSLGTVFFLNSVALLTFPAIGRSLGLTQEQFGTWAALAIHDTSSVVGAGFRYGPRALAVATTIKLARALWILPLALATAGWRRSKAKLHWPWFIFLFAAAAGLSTAVAAGAPAWQTLSWAGRKGLVLTLFLIGAGISRTTLAKIGARPFLQGLLLWIVVAGASLALIRLK